MLADQRAKSSVVITGAANGIGRSIVLRLATSGWAVVGVDRDVTGLDDAIGAVGGVPVPGDIRDNDVLAEARRVAERAGQLRAWVNNAGIVRLGPLHVMTPEVIDETLDIDLRAVVFGTREALSSFLANGVAGSIVNVSSVHAQSGFPGYGPYDAAKGGVEALTRYVCAEYGHLGIRCNAVAPGAVNTTIATTSPTQRRPLAPDPDATDLSPMRRVSEPEEIAEVVAFLLEGPSYAINGHVLAVDNGLLARNCALPPDSAVVFDRQPGQ